MASRDNLELDQLFIIDSAFIAIIDLIHNA